MAKAKILNFSKKELETMINQSESFKDFLLQLGYQSISGDTYKIVRKKLDELEINYQELINKRKIQRILTDEIVFCLNSTVDQKTMKKRIIKQNLLKYECLECGISEWNGKKLSLHLDHINGINNDNRLENLRFLCPNCHSQTDTYAAKNMGASSNG